jgi:hypothetical protein
MATGTTNYSAASAFRGTPSESAQSENVLYIADTWQGSFRLFNLDQFIK